MRDLRRLLASLANKPELELKKSRHPMKLHSSLNSDLKILRETVKNAFEAERNAMLDDISKYDSQPRLICFETEVKETF